MISLATLAAMPILVPLATACVCSSLRDVRLATIVSRIGASAWLACNTALLVFAARGEIATIRFGNWAPPAAIEFRIDRLGALMLFVAAALFAISLLYPASRGRKEEEPSTQALLHGLMAGIGGAFSTADLFNLYVWFEVLLIGALGLVVRRGRPAELEAGFKYLALNLFGTLLLLISVAGLYGLTGQLGFRSIGAALAPLGADPLTKAYVALLFVALLVKAGSFPFYFWLPVTYPMLPPATQALFAGLMTKVGAYALLRVVGEIYAGGAADLLVGLGWIAAATMVLGVLGAAYHYDTRRILAFHSVSQIGYILLAISLGTRAGFAAAMFFVIHHIVVKANLFLVGGLMEQFGGSFDLRKTGGLHSSAPIIAVLFAISASALVGIPPLSGFWAKMLVVRESFVLGHGFFAVLALGVGGLTLFSMAKVWIEAFWRPHPADEDAPKSPPAPRALVACGALALVAVLLGVVPGPLVAYLDAAVAGMGHEGPK